MDATIGTHSPGAAQRPAFSSIPPGPPGSPGVPGVRRLRTRVERPAFSTVHAHHDRPACRHPGRAPLRAPPAGGADAGDLHGEVQRTARRRHDRLQPARRQGLRRPRPRLVAQVLLAERHGAGSMTPGLVGQADILTSWPASARGIAAQTFRPTEPRGGVRAGAGLEDDDGCV